MASTPHTEAKKIQGTPPPLGRDRLSYHANLIDNVSEALISTDMEFKVLEWNAAAERMYGWKADEVMGHTLKEILQCEYTDTTGDAVVRTILEAGIWKGEVLQIRKDGTRFSVLASVSLIKANEGKPAGFVAINHDITERKQEERETLRLKRLYATLSQVNQTIVRVQDEKGLYQAICDVSVEFGEFILAWVGLLNESTGDVRPVAANGLDVEQWPFDRINIHTGSAANDLIARAIRTGQVMVSDDLQNDETLQRQQPSFEPYRYRASACMPIRLQGKTVGVLNLFSSESGFFQSPAELQLLEEMGLDISLALDRMEIEVERRRAQEQLEILKYSIDTAMDGAYWMDKDGRFLYVNDAGCKDLGYTREELLQMHIGDVNPGVTPERWSQTWKYLKENINYTSQSTHRRKDGSEFPVEITSTYIRFGQQEYCNGFAKNIAERKWAEAEILSLAKFPGENPNPILRISKDGILLYANSSSQPLLELWGCSTGSTLPAPLREIIAEALQLGGPKEIEVSCNGKVFSLIFAPVLEADYLNGYGRDITDRKRAEQQLRMSETRFRLLFENNHMVMMLIDPVSGEIKNANAAAAKFYGYSLRELRSMSIDQINQLSPEEVYEERMRALREERNYFNFRHRLSSGEIRFVEVYSAPLEVDEKKFLFSIVNDITDRKQAEGEVQARSRQLAALLETSQSLTASLNLADILQKITDNAAEVLGVKTTALYLLDGENLYLGASTPPLPPEFPDAFRRATLADHPHMAEALATGQLVIVRDTASATLTDPERMVSNALRLRTVLYIPVAGRREAVGVLTVGTQGKTREFSGNEQDLVRTLSNQAALAISNAKLYEDQTGYVKELESLVTERKRAEEQLHLVVESAPNAILLVGNDGRLRLVNAQVENYFGYGRAELIGMEIDRIIPDRFRSRHSVRFADFLADPRPRWMGMGRDLYGLRKDGTEFPAEIGLTPLKSQEEPLVMVTIVDITVRKQTEERLQRQFKRLNALRMIDIAISSSFNQSVILDVVLQQVHSQLGVDASALLLFDAYLQRIEYSTSRGFRSNLPQNHRSKLWEGYARQVVLERKTLHFSEATDQERKLATSLQLKNESFIDYYGTPLIIKGEVKGVLEIYNRSALHPDREWLDFLETLAGQAAIAIDNAQMFAGLQKVNTELEQRVAERTAELNRINAELEHANRAKDEFLANMSHELRTPLTGILGLSESLLEERRGSLNDYQQRSLQIIETSGHHLLELINDILDLSKIEAGKFDFYPQGVLVNELCKASLTFIKSLAAKKSIQIHFDNQAQVSEIFADARRLKQILVNLLSNAVKFTPEEGTVTLEVTTRLEQDLIQFSVIDTGIGISHENLQRVFQPFVQLDGSLNRQHEGTGLGLALVQKLTDLHGGSILVESEVGKGSRFTINLNCRQDILTKSQGPGLVSQVAETELPEQKGTSSAVPARRGQILLAEDNLPNILTIGEYLESYGFEVVAAHDGLEAIAKVEETHPDLILMDIQMPVMNGLEAIARLRADERFGSTPIIALTALAMPGDRERCLEAGANEYLSKPVNLKRLLQTIQGLTKRQS